MKGKIVLTSVLLATVAVGIIMFSVKDVNAQTSNSSTVTGLIQKIAKKFNLNQADVKAVFDDFRNERHAKKQVDLEKRLNDAVASGKITGSQKQAILKKFSENMKFENFKNMKPDGRRQEIEMRKDDLSKWASENGLTLEILNDLLGHKGGLQGGWHKGMCK